MQTKKERQSVSSLAQVASFLFLFVRKGSNKGKGVFLSII